MAERATRPVTLILAAMVGMFGCSTRGTSAPSTRSSDEAAASFRRAATLYAQACENGYADSCARLGTLYLHGQGVPRDDARAAALWDKGCSGGVPYSCAALGWAYAGGKGVVKDERRAA